MTGDTRLAIQTGDRARAIAGITLSILLGAVFVAAGIAKLASGRDFLTALSTYPVLPVWVAGPTIILLPWVELALGIMLIGGWFRRTVLSAAGLITMVFIYLNSYAIISGSNSSCGCLGQIAPMTHHQSLLLDVFMLASVACLFTLPARPQVSLRRLTRRGVLLAKTLLAFLLAVILIAGPSAPVGAADPDRPQPQLAPLNPHFAAMASAGPQTVTGTSEMPGRLGLIPSPMDLGHLKTVRPATTPQSLSSLPASFDWRAFNKVTPVRNQGTCGTCWVFGNIAAMESRVLVVEGAVYDFSEQNLTVCTDPSYVYLTADRCGGGGELLMAPDTLVKKGARLESCHPYNPATINTDVCKDTCATIVRATDWRLVADSPDRIAEIKNAIYNYGPVTAAYVVAGGHMFEVNGKYVYYWPNCSEAANHLVAIVGWDDDVPHPSGGGSGAWIVKNSWGTGWANQGYFYLAYGSANLQGVGSFHGSAGYVPGGLAERLYYWDEAGLVNAMGYGSSTAWMGALFTAAEAGYLTRVEFWTTSDSASYQLFVYDGSFSGATLARQEGTCPEMGYYSIRLDPPVALAGGQDFAIAVRMTTPGYNFPIPTEYAIQGFVSPPIQQGRTFARVDGGNWLDTSSNGINVCLRARVQSAQAPLPPTGLTAIAVSSTAIRLDWTDRSNNETGFKIERKTGLHGSYLELATTGAGTTSYIDSGLYSGTTYYYRVRAVNDTASSEYCDEAHTTTQPASITVTSPNGGESWPVGSLQSIAWTSSNVPGTVKIELSRDGGANWQTLFTESSGGTAKWAVSGDTTSRARVRVSSNSLPGVQDTSDADFSIIPPAVMVTTGAATGVNSTSATLNGNLTSLGTASTVSVSFEYGTSVSYGTSTAVQSMTSTGAFSHHVSGLTPNTIYHYRAKADGGSAGTAVGPDVAFTTLTSQARVSVNYGTSIDLNPDRSRGGIPVTISNIPSLGTGNGVASFAFNLTWDPAVIRIDGLSGSSITGWTITPGAPDNIAGTVSVTGSTTGNYLTQDTTVAHISLTATGSSGSGTTIAVTVTGLADRNSQTIPSIPVGATVNVTNLQAETAAVPGSDPDGVIVVNVNIDRIKDVTTGNTAVIPGGIGAFSATASVTPPGSVAILGIREVSPYLNPALNTGGIFSVSGVTSPEQPDHSTVARLVVRLNGEAGTPSTLNIEFQQILAAAGAHNVPEQQPNALIFRRGDARPDGNVDIFDAMYIAQYIVGNRPLSQLNALNAASVRHDNGGDRIDIFDAMYIAQYIVGIRNNRFEQTGA